MYLIDSQMELYLLTFILTHILMTLMCLLFIINFIELSQIFRYVQTLRSVSRISRKPIKLKFVTHTPYFCDDATC